MTSTFLNYFIWAIIQHGIVLLTCWTWPEEVVTSIFLSIILFTLAHFPNFKLMPITLIASFFIYYIFGILLINFGLYALIWFLPVNLIHSYIGRVLIKKGMDLRVLWLHPNWQKLFISAWSNK